MKKLALALTIVSAPVMADTPSLNEFLNRNPKASETIHRAADVAWCLHSNSLVANNSRQVDPARIGVLNSIIWAMVDNVNNRHGDVVEQWTRSYSSMGHLPAEYIMKKNDDANCANLNGSIISVFKI